MLKKVSFNFRGKRISIDIKECQGLNKFLGLMFKNREDANALLFEFKKPVNLGIHSFFVFFPFVAIWFNEKNKVIGSKKVRPFTLSIKTKEPYKKLLEIPLNERYKKKIKLLVGD